MVKSLLKKYVWRLLLVTSLMSVSLLSLAADIHFTNASTIEGAGAKLCFDGYGTTYQKDVSMYSASVETEPTSSLKINAVDAAGPYFYCALSAVPSGRTIITLTYSNGDCGKAVFDGSTFSSSETCGSVPSTPPSLGEVSVYESIKGSAVLKLKVTGTSPISFTATCDGTPIDAASCVYSAGKLTITSSLFTVGSHTVSVTATNDYGSDSKSGISVSTSDKLPSCGTANGLAAGKSVEYLFGTNSDNTITITIFAGNPLQGTAICYLPGGGYTMTIVNGVASYTTTTAYTSGQTINDIYFTWNDGTGETNSSGDKKSYTVGTICHDSEAPEWSGEPTFAFGGKRMAVFNVKATDNAGLTGFYVTLDGCSQVFVPVAKTVSYDGTLSVSLPDGCPDLSETSTTAVLYIKDEAGLMSQPKTVGDIVKTDLEPVMISAECQPNYYKNSIILAVSAQKGSSNIAKYHVVCSSPLVDKYVDGTESGTITVDGLTSNKSYTFNVWAVDEKDLQSENYVSATTNCITASEPGIISNLKEGYAFRGSEVKLTAVGFDAGSSFVWESAESAEGPWTPISGGENSVIVYPLIAGSNFYRTTGLASGVQTTKTITILAKVSCDVTGSAGQQVIWKETFDDNKFETPEFDRFECQWVPTDNYKFSSWTDECGIGEGKYGKVCDGYYVVVANSSASGPESFCGWPQNKCDHTSGNGTSGFIIINAGAPKKVMYEQKITPETGFCDGVYYNFSLFATNIASSEADPARFAFDIVEVMDDDSEIYLVKEHDSGIIQGSRMESWYEYGVSFVPQKVDKLKNIIVRIWNTGASNNGNDVVIDDISVSICKPTASAFIGEQSEGKKEESGVSCGTAVELNAVVNGYVGDFFPSTPYYLWQKQLEGSQEWVEVTGEHSKTYMYTTDPSEKAKFRCIIASNENTARLVIGGTTDTGCGTYAWTDVLSVQCNSNCDNPASISWDETSGEQTQAICAGTQITDIKFQLGGSATGFAIEGLPDGLTVSPEPGSSVTGSTITISGAPTANGSFKITTIGQQYPCSAATISGSVAVIDNPTIVEVAPKECSDDFESYTYSVKVSDGTVTADVTSGSGSATVEDKGNNVWKMTASKGTNVRLTVTSGSCSATLDVTAPDCQCPVMAAPTGENSEYCDGSEATPLIITSEVGDDYDIFWYDAKGTKVANGKSYTPANPGTYTAKLIYKIKEMCQSAGTQLTQTKNDRPSVNVSAEYQILTCDRNSILIVAEALGGSQSGYTYSWNDGEYTTNAKYEATVIGDYSVKVKDGNDCFSDVSQSVSITENRAKPQFKISAASTEINCRVTEIELLAEATDGGGYSFQWKNGPATANYKVKDANTYYVTAKNDDNGCTSTKDINIIENKETPSVYIEPKSPEITCVALEVTLRAVATGVSYKWSNNETTESIKVKTGGEYSVIVTDIANGCSSTADVAVADVRKFTEVKLNAEFPYGSSADNYLVGAGEVTIDAVVISGENPYKIDWYVNDKLVQSSEDAELLITPYTDSNVKVIAYSLCNHSDDAIDIKVVWPTIVTPHNIDGQNDDFVVGTGVEVRLFDRTGNMVYHGNDGVPADVLSRLQPAVYYYQAVLPDGNVRKSMLEVYKK